jgi:hypothetical protein
MRAASRAERCGHVVAPATTAQWPLTRPEGRCPSSPTVGSVPPSRRLPRCPPPHRGGRFFVRASPRPPAPPAPGSDSRACLTSSAARVRLARRPRGDRPDVVEQLGGRDVREALVARERHASPTRSWSAQAPRRRRPTPGRVADTGPAGSSTEPDVSCPSRRSATPTLVVFAWGGPSRRLRCACRGARQRGSWRERAGPEGRDGGVCWRLRSLRCSSLPGRTLSTATSPRPRSSG